LFDSSARLVHLEELEEVISLRAQKLKGVISRQVGSGVKANTPVTPLNEKKRAHNQQKDRKHALYFH
jgi:hypothetical protein